MPGARNNVVGETNALLPIDGGTDSSARRVIVVVVVVGRVIVVVAVLEIHPTHHSLRMLTVSCRLLAQCSGCISNILLCCCSHINSVMHVQNSREEKAEIFSR